MIKASLVSCKGGIQDKIKEMSKASGEYAEAGWFQEQGKHPTAQMTYPELAHYHATGTEGVPVRDVIRIVKGMYDPKDEPKVKEAISKWFNNPTDSTLKVVLDMLGETAWSKIKTVVGNPAYLQVTGNPTPLKDSGALYDHVARRTSKDRTIKT